MELYFLGTGAGLPSKQRNVSSLALTLYNERGTMWMFDCGEATQHQIIHSPLRLTKLEKLFISHLHGDHIFGIPGLLASRSSQGAESPLTIYGPVGLKSYIDTVLKISQSVLQFRLDVIEVSEGIIFQDDLFTVRAKMLNHGITCFGYRVEEKDRPGTFFPEQAKQAGIPEGPFFSRLKKGEQIVLEDGRVFSGSQFVGPTITGRKLAVVGDTRPCDAAIELSYQANVLVHEATFSHTHLQLAMKYNHSTAYQAARLAKDSNVETLILTHLSARYQGQTEQLVLAEAKSVFPMTWIAQDHFSHVIARTK